MNSSVPGYVAVDIGGTKLAAAVVALDGSVIVSDRVPTPARDPWNALSALISRVVAATPDVAPAALGAGCGGPMTRGGEAVSPLHIPSWRDFPLRESLSSLLDVPVAIDNDAKALALGEGWLGAARGCRDYMAVVIGTGVGAGLVIDGTLVDGATGNAGHLGHVVVEDGGLECRCGAHGCLEAYLSGSGIESRTGQSARQASAAIIVDAGRRFGRAVASVAALTSLERVIVAGSVALGWGDVFFDAAREEFGARSRLSFTQSVEIVPAGPRAGLLGAAALARRLVHVDGLSGGQFSGD